MPPFDVVLSDETEAASNLRVAPALAAGAQARFDFDWTPLQTGPHTLTATLLLGDQDPSNDQASADVAVLVEPPGLSLRLWAATAPPTPGHR